jgi:hypothetical protein
MSIAAFYVVILYGAGERRALRFQDDGALTGVYGPLLQREAKAGALAQFNSSTEPTKRFMSENVVMGSAR